MSFSVWSIWSNTISGLRIAKKAGRKINTHYLQKDSRILCFPSGLRRKTRNTEAHFATIDGTLQSAATSESGRGRWWCE